LKKKRLLKEGLLPNRQTGYNPVVGNLAMVDGSGLIKERRRKMKGIIDRDRKGERGF